MLLGWWSGFDGGAWGWSIGVAWQSEKHQGAMLVAYAGYFGINPLVLRTFPLEIRGKGVARWEQQHFARGLFHLWYDILMPV